MKNELTTEQILNEKQAVHAMSMTDGWQIIKERLESEREEMIELLLSITAIPENMPKVAQTQAQINGVSYVLDMVRDYTTPDEDDNE